MCVSARETNIRTDGDSRTLVVVHVVVKHGVVVKAVVVFIRAFALGQQTDTDTHAHAHTAPLCLCIVWGFVL